MGNLLVVLWIGSCKWLRGCLGRIEIKKKKPEVKAHRHRDTQLAVDETGLALESADRWGGCVFVLQLTSSVNISGSYSPNSKSILCPKAMHAYVNTDFKSGAYTRNLDQIHTHTHSYRNMHIQLSTHTHMGWFHLRMNPI